MIKKKRTNAEREADLVRVSELYVKGYNYQQIADNLSLTRRQVEKDVSALMTRWQHSYVEDIHMYKVAELEKINLIEKEAWVAWERSKGGKKINTKTLQESDQFGRSRTSSITDQESHGDIQYLQTIQWCVNQRARILGIFAPAKVAATDVTGEKDAAEVARREIITLIDQVAGRIGGKSQSSPQNLLEAMRDSSSVVDSPAIDEPEVIDIDIDAADDDVDDPEPAMGDISAMIESRKPRLEEERPIRTRKTGDTFRQALSALESSRIMTEITSEREHED